MRNVLGVTLRMAAVLVVAGLVLVAGLGLSVRAGDGAGLQAARVQMVDNAGTFAPGDPLTGQWGFAPAHITVQQGDAIVFENPAGNFRPHTVTSITAGGTPIARTLESGTVFDSSPTQDTLIAPGQSWTLDTSGLAPGHYTYYCKPHPWMVATFTVMGSQ